MIFTRKIKEDEYSIHLQLTKCLVGTYYLNHGGHNKGLWSFLPPDHIQSYTLELIHNISELLKEHNNKYSQTYRREQQRKRHETEERLRKALDKTDSDIFPKDLFKDEDPLSHDTSDILKPYQRFRLA